MTKNEYRQALAELVDGKSEYSSQALGEIVGYALDRLEEIERLTKQLLNDNTFAEVFVAKALKNEKTLKILKNYFDFSVVDESEPDKTWRAIFISPKKNQLNRFVASGNIGWDEYEITREVLE